jgi:hypothetical protein
MPYVKPEVRARLDGAVEALALALSNEGLDPGAVNYALSRTILRSAAMAGVQWRYSSITMVVGVLQTMVLEFYRRVAAPYEDAKRDENGDVF